MPIRAPLGPLYAAVIGRLREGWTRVAEGSAMEGTDGVSPRMFELKLEEELAALEKELRARRYRPRPLFAFGIPKPGGGTRRLAVPAVRDRVVQAATLAVLDPLIEAELAATSFAYRRGRSWKDALAAVERFRDEGYTWVVDADVDDFFDRVDHGLLIERLGEVAPDDDLLGLVRAWVAAEEEEKGGRRRARTRGLPQGAVISPLLANLFLDDLDEALQAGGFRLVRYADDFLVLCRSKPRAQCALRLTTEVLDRLALHLDPAKTRITSFDDGFRFLGALFVRSLMLPQAGRGPTALLPTRAAPPASEAPAPEAPSPEFPSRGALERTALGRALLHALDAEGVALADFVGALTPPEAPLPAALTPDEAEPDEDGPAPPTGAGATLRPGERPFRRTLYVQHQGAWLRLNAGRFVVTVGREVRAEVLAVPAALVDQVVTFGSVLITPAALRYCLRRGIAVTLLSSRGRYYGQVESTEHVHVDRLRLQVLRSLDPVFRLDLARRFVQGRLRGQRAVLRRYARRLDDAVLADAAGEVSRILRRTERARDLDTLRGLEGQAAALYFGVFGRMLHATPFTFEGRTRRPPTDPVNAMLSFGYTLLHQNLYALLHLRRLSPYVGVLHAERRGHPALASDLQEEFRALVERLALSLANAHRLTPADFPAPSDGEPGCYLTDAGRRRFLGAFERLMRRAVTHPASGRRVSVRRCLDLQTRALVRHLEGTAAYVPYAPP